MKKTISLILALGMVVTLFAGCGSKASTTTVDSSSKAGAKKNITLTYLASQDWLKDPEKELAKKFEAETGIKIDFQIVPSDQYTNMLKTKLNAKESTDIFGSQSGKWDLIPNIQVDKNAVDLSNEEWANRMDPLVKEQLTANNKLYGISLIDVTSNWFIVYNKTIFQKLNLSIPKTYAEFKTVCKTISDSGVTPVYECVSDGWHHVLWFPEMGPQFENLEKGLGDKLNNNQSKFADSKAILTDLNQVQDMVKSGFWGKNYMSNTYTDTEKNMASGKYAMTVYNLGLPDQIQKAFPDVKSTDFGYFPIPLDDNQIVNVNPAGPSKFIWTGSKNIPAAKQYFEYLAKQENLQYFLDNVSTYSQLCFSGLKDKYTPEQKKFFDTYKVKGTVYQTQLKYLNPQWEDIGKDLSGMFLGGVTPESVLKNIDNRRTEAGKAAKDAAWTK